MEQPASAKGVTIGDKFRITRGKGKSAYSRDYTVVDIHTTVNTTGEIVKIEFKAVFDLMGQQVSEMVLAPTVLRNKIA